MKIITLGNSNSGKSNYMGLSLAYICRYWEDLPMLGTNSHFINNVDQSENQMQSGIWLDKTHDPTQYEFKVKLPSRNPLATPEELGFLVEDWPGEDFEALGNSEKDTSEPDLKSKRREKKALFKDAIRNSGSYVIFLDGEKLKNKGVESNVQRSLGALRDLLQADPPLSLSERRFAFVVTKVDVLENLDEFIHKSKDGLDITKLEKLVKSKYTTFFNFLDWHKLEYRIFAVSCVPKKENRQVDPENGTKPTASWSLEDMRHSLVVDCSSLLQLITLGLAKSERERHPDQLAPFRWLFRYNGD